MACINIIDFYKIASQQGLDSAKQALSNYVQKRKDILSIDDVVEEFKKTPTRIRNTFPPNIREFFLDAKQLREFLSTLDKPTKLPESLDNPYKEEPIDNPQRGAVISKLSNTWLNRAWGTAILSREKFIQSVNRDFDNGVLELLYQDNDTQNVEVSINGAIKSFILSKINNLRNYLSSIGIDTSVIDNNNIFDPDGDPQSVINEIIREYTPFFKNMSDDEKMAYQNNGYSENMQKKAQAYADFLIIQPRNLDYYIKKHLGSITINPMFIGQLTLSDNKYKVQLGKGKQNTSWQDEEATYIISKMVDSLVQVKIQSWPKYRKQGNIWTIQANQYADLNTVVIATSKLLTLSQLRYTRNKIYDKENDQIIKDLKTTFKPYFGENVDKVIDEYIDQKSLADIIDSVSQDYEHLLPILFYLVTYGKTSLIEELKYDSKKPNKIYLNTNEVDTLVTIYKNMFDPTNPDSLFSKSVNGTYFDIYEMISQILLTHDRKNLFGIVNDNGEIGKKDYSTGRANKNLNLLQNRINGIYHPSKDLSFTDVEITSNFDEGRKAVEIKYPKSSDVPYRIIVDTGTITYYKGETKISPNTFNEETLQDFSRFIRQALGLNNENFQQFLNIYKNLLNGSANQAAKNLLNLISKLIYAHEVSTKLKGLSVWDFNEEVKNYYKTEKVKRVNNITGNQIDVFSNQFPVISLISLANDINRGVMGDVIVKGGNGEKINSVVLSSLATNFLAWFNEKSKTQDGVESAISHFSIKDAFKRITFFRDYVGKKGDVKASTAMSVEELFIASLFYDFYGEEHSGSDESSYATLMGVLSDKPNLARAEIFRNSEIFVGYDSDNKEIYKKISDLNAKELKVIVGRELGQFYSKMIKEIKRNLSILNTYSNYTYIFDTDYKELRGIPREVLENDIHQAILKAKKAGENIEINDYLYFSWDKEGNIRTKPSIQAEHLKHTVGIDDFFATKEAEFVVDILQDLRKGIKLIDSDGVNLSSQAVKNLKRKNTKKDTTGNVEYGTKDSWTTRDSLIVAKILYGDNFKNLVNKNSIKKWKKYENLIKYIQDQELNQYDLSRLDIDGDFDLLYFINTYNELQPIINENNKLKKIKKTLAEIVRGKLQTKLQDKPVTEKQKDYVKAKYLQFINERIENGEFEARRNLLSEELGRPVSNEELAQSYFENYVTGVDERTWKARYIRQYIRDLNLQNINSIEELNVVISSEKLTKNKDLKQVLEETYENNELNLVVNPELQRYNTLNYLFSEEILNSTVGSHVNHKAKFTEDLQLLGALEAAAQTKRNVSLSGAKNKYLRDIIQGLGKNMVIATVRDLKAGISTINGIEDSKATTPLDGATIGNYVTRIEELYSLGSQKAGVDNSKPLANDHNPKTGTGTIIKTAVFVLTNSRIRKSEVNIRIHKKMNHIQWNNSFNGDFLHDFFGKEIKYHPVIVYKPDIGKYYLRTNFAINQTDGTTSFYEFEINDDIIQNVEGVQDAMAQGNFSPELLSKLKVTSDNLVSTSRPIRTNYELWDLFGGAYSASYVNGKLNYANDNTSLDNLTTACHNCGEILTKGDIKRLTEEDVFLPLKNAKVDWIVTEGAIKQGMSNVNSRDLFFDDNYEMTTQTISTADNGMQLNPEHETDESHLTLMTQVVNALGLRGFSADVAEKVYAALYNLTEISLKDLFDGIQLNITSTDSGKFKKAVSQLLIKAIAGTSETDGDLLSSIVLQLKNVDLNSDYDVIKDKLPISDPQILNKIISNFNALMTKKGIRLTFPGSMNVLVPSNGIYKIHGNRVQEIANTSRYGLEGDLIPNNSRDFENQKLQQLQAQQLPKKLHEITIGASYFITIDGILYNNGESVSLEDLSTYYEIRNLLQGKNYTLVEDVIKGRDLAPYNASFRTKTGENFMLWDLDSIRHIHMLENNPTKVEEIRLYYDDSAILQEFHVNSSGWDRTTFESFKRDFKKAINARRQVELNAIGSGNNSQIYVNGKSYNVDKSTLKVSPYELIASSNYATTFGLQIGDDLSEISQNKNFFLQRFLNNYKGSVDSNNYDIVLKTISGKDYYILYKDRGVKIPRGLELDTNFNQDILWEGTKAYRVDSDGNRLYQIPYHVEGGKTIYDIEVYRDSKGNEIIYANTLQDLIGKLSFSTIDFGRHILNNSDDSIKKLISEIESIEPKYVRSISNNLPIKQIPTKTIKATIKDWIDNKDVQLLKLQTAINNKEDINYKDYDGFLRMIIRASNEIHTSFLKSLDYIVSRTPAQSHQSFMPMKLVGFDDSGINSAYVSRYQLYLQGSDYDVDKASLLGSIIRNGKYVKWSPYMNLLSIEALRASEKLPFPTGKDLQVVDELNTRMYDSIDKPIDLIWNEDGSVKFNISGKEVNLYVDESNNYYTDLTEEGLTNFTDFEKYVLLRAIVDKIPEGSNFISNLNLSHLGIINNIKTKEYDYVRDFIEFNQALYNELINESGKINYQDPQTIIKLAILIDCYDKFGKFLSSLTAYAEDKKILQTIQDIVNIHNNYFNKKYSPDSQDAVTNFISSNMFQISSDPVNLIQAMTSVDYLTEIIKSKASESPLAKQAEHFDKGNMMALFRQLRLTLAGKQNTGIEASALKVYEAMNQYICSVLNYGTEEEQQALISKVPNIAGMDIHFIANAYAKNIANVKSKNVYDALQQVDQDNDSALWLSAFLSLSTDNAKDPTLAKINANPEMIGLFNAGFVLGIPFDILIKTMMSPTSNVLMKLQGGNVFFEEQKLQDVTRAIDYIQSGPRLNYLTTPAKNILKQVLALYTGVNEDVDPYTLVSKIIPDKYNEIDLLQARHILNLVRNSVFGKNEDSIKYDLPNISLIVENKLKKSRKRLERLQKLYEVEQKARDLVVESNRGHKRIDARLENIKNDLEKLVQNIEQLEDIKESLSVGQGIPLKSGEIYESLRKQQDSIEKLTNVQNANLSNIDSSKFRGEQVRVFKRFLQDMEYYLDCIEEIQEDKGVIGVDGTWYSSLKVLKELNYFAHEMSLVRPILGLNQQLPNSKEDLLSFINSFENILEERLSVDKSNSSIKEFQDFNHRLGYSSNKVSAIDFVYNEEYREAAIKAYDKVMYKVNILRLITKVPHYFGYLKTATSTHYALVNRSIQYREQTKILDKVIREDLGITSKKDIRDRLKLASKYISRKINNSFLLSRNITINLPEGPIKLGTVEGNIAFKKWMETNMIPKYKKVLTQNAFFDSLNEVAHNNTDNRNTILSYTTGIDSMSNNESDKLFFAKVQEGFSKLSTLANEKVTTLPIPDLFFYYDLITYDRQPGQNSLTPIFNNLIANESSGLLKDYIKFISNLDSEGVEIIKLDPQTIDEIERFIAPKVSIYGINDAKDKYIFVKDPEDSEFKLLKRKEKQSRDSNQLIDDDIENYEDYDQESFDWQDYVSIDQENGYTPITLNSILNDETCQYSLVSSTYNVRNPYLLDFEETHIAKDGKIVVSNKFIQIESESLSLDPLGRFVFSDKFEDRLRSINPNIKLSDIPVKTAITQSGPIKIIDSEIFLEMLENECN